MEIPPEPEVVKVASDKEIVEVPPEPEVVEIVSPSLVQEEKGEAASCPGVSSQTSILRFHCVW